MDVSDIMYEECLSDTLLMDVSYIIGRESASQTISVRYPIDGCIRQMDVSDIMYEECLSDTLLMDVSYNRERICLINNICLIPY